MANYNLFSLSDNSKIVTPINVVKAATRLNYSLSYTAGIAPRSFPYILTYKTNNLQLTKLSFKVSYTKNYDDTRLVYGLSYTRNREIETLRFNYKASYKTTLSKPYSIFYLLSYTIQKEITTKRSLYTLKYSTSTMSTSHIPYSFSYTTLGTDIDKIRARYKFRYLTDSVGSNSIKCVLKYSISSFINYNNYYSLQYTTQLSERIITDTVLLKTSISTYDLLVRVRTSTLKQLDEFLYVFSNLPKYQLLEYTVGEDLPYVDVISSGDQIVRDLFEPNTYPSYQDIGCILIKNIDPNNTVSLDVYSLPDYIKVSRAKSNLFNINDDKFIPYSLLRNNTEYISKNYNTNEFQYEYLNFVEDSITPIFNPGETCCFSQKIESPNSKVKGGDCSPF